MLVCIEINILMPAAYVAKFHEKYLVVNSEILDSFKKNALILILRKSTKINFESRKKISLSA